MVTLDVFALINALQGATGLRYFRSKNQNMIKILTNRRTMIKRYIELAGTAKPGTIEQKMVLILNTSCVECFVYHNESSVTCLSNTNGR